MYFHTNKAREISHEHVKNLAEWVELFFRDLHIKKVEYEARSGELPEVCYLGKTQYINVIEFCRLTVYNSPEKYRTIEGLELIEVNKENYLEIG